MLKLNLVLILLFLNVSVFADDEKFIGCVIEREQVWGPMLLNSDTTDFIKTYEPLISIKGGKFEMLIGNEHNEEKFPDGIDYHFIGKPKTPSNNIYSWDHSFYKKLIDEYSIQEALFPHSISLRRDDLVMTIQRAIQFDGFEDTIIKKTYSCRLIDMVNFVKYKKEMSDRYLKLNEEVRQRISKWEKDEAEKLSKNKI